MATKTTKKVSKKVTKVTSEKITFTKGQVESVAAFYSKQGKKVPMFIVKKLAQKKAFCVQPLLSTWQGLLKKGK